MPSLRTRILPALLFLLASCAVPGAASPTLTPASEPESPSEGAAQPTGSQAASPTPTPAGPTAATGLAFIREVAGTPQVFVVDTDGSERQVSGLAPDASAAAVRPFWSPDRSMIAFRPRAIGSGADPQLWIVDADGSGQRPLATVGEFITWSSDSRSLLYQDSTLTTDTTGQPARIWLLDVASGDRRLLVEGDLPQWLPDGEHFSYVPAGAGGGDTVPFVVAGLDGGEPRRLAEARFISWSPDGSALLLEQFDGLYLASPDGTDAEYLFGGAGAVWSPDGQRVVYQYDHDADALPIIGVVDRDGNVLWSGRVGGDPTWSPDGRKLAVEVGYPTTSIQVLDAGTGQVLWEVDGEDPAW